MHQTVLSIGPGSLAFSQVLPKSRERSRNPSFPGGPLPLEEALQVGRQIAEALEAAHERGIIHRDLKPANVMLTPEGRVKVLDFGLARGVQTNDAPADTVSQYESQTGKGVILGTPAYMAPEQARGRSVDRRCDIWALGCVLFEAITGRQAFRGETFQHRQGGQKLQYGYPSHQRA